MLQTLARWRLVAGPTGAGNTTVARALAEQIGGVRFTIDDRMTTLFWPDLPLKHHFPWAMERVRRCEAQIATVALTWRNGAFRRCLTWGLRRVRGGTCRSAAPQQAAFQLSST